MKNEHAKTSTILCTLKLVDTAMGTMKKMSIKSYLGKNLSL